MLNISRNLFTNLILIIITIQLISNINTNINTNFNLYTNKNKNLKFLQSKNSTISNQAQTQNQNQETQIQKTEKTEKKDKENLLQFQDLEGTGNWMLNLQLGNPPQNFNLEIDTSLSTTWLPSIDCSNCKVENKYFYNSTASISSRVTNQTILIKDYLGNFKGLQVQDELEIKIDSINFKMENFTFLKAIELYQENFNNFRKGKIAFSNKYKYGKRFSLLNILYNKKIIPKKLFALDYDKINKKGNIYFTESQIKKKNLPEKNWGKCNLTSTEDFIYELKDSWTCELTHVYFEDKEKKLNLNNTIENDSRVIFHSSYNYIGISMDNYNLIYYSYILKNFGDKCVENIIYINNKNNKNKEIYYICNITAKEIFDAESFYFIIQGFIIEIPAYDLFIKSNNNNDSENKYLLGLRFFGDEKDENSKIFIFGKLFLKNLLTIFDAENQQIRFYKENLINITSEWEEYYYSNNYDYYSMLFNRNFYLVIAAGIVITLFMLFVCFICSRRSALRRKYEHGPLIENEIK
jgi:hypothetical protein